MHICGPMERENIRGTLAPERDFTAKKPRKPPSVISASVASKLISDTLFDYPNWPEEFKRHMQVQEYSGLVRNGLIFA